MARTWKTSKREIPYSRVPLVMGILNVTPDSFSDGGKYLSVEAAVKHAEEIIHQGADIIDIGGESTRPGSQPVSTNEELLRVIPVIKAISRQFEIPISIDTTKSEVAERAVEAGAEIINDISGLRSDPRIAAVAGTSNAALILMNSRGSGETMHKQLPVDDIMAEVSGDFRRAVDLAKTHGVRDEQIAFDIGIGFSKSQDQNLELLAKLDNIVAGFKGYPVMVGTSRKSFIAKIIGDIPPSERLAGSLATAIYAVLKGASILRVHDVRETKEALRVVSVIEERRQKL